MTNFLKHFLLLYLFIQVCLISQIRITEIPTSNLAEIDPVFVNTNEFRRVINLNRNWNIYLESSPNQVIDANLPLLFKETETLIFTKTFETSHEIIENSDLFFIALGINYSAEILLNDAVIFKNDVANIPIRVDLSSELLKTTEPNTITIKVRHALDSENTIPVYQRFLFPENIGGITRDVFIEMLPKNRISNLIIENSATGSKIKVDFDFIKNFSDTAKSNYSYSISINDGNGNNLFGSSVINLNLNESQNSSYSSEFNTPSLPVWSPSAPNYLIVSVDLFKDKLKVDRCSQYFLSYNLVKTKTGFVLNGKPFEFSGVTYNTREFESGNRDIYSSIETDLKLMKNLGVNTVRFANQIPHPYGIIACQKLGLFAFIELPLNSIPGEIIENENFKYRATNAFYKLLENYSNYGAVAAIGISSGNNSTSEVQNNFISELGKKIKNKTNKLSYASFWNVPRDDFDDLDLIGIELHANDLQSTFQIIDQTSNKIDINKFFISEATYPNYQGNRSGYSVEYSIEAQAKYYEDVINLSREHKLAGFIFNSMFDLKGDFPSFFTAYNYENNYNIGILENNESLESIPFKVIRSKVSKSERITIPIGSKSEDSILFFIFTGLGLAIFLGILVNSKKKFREDATRALLRPYNFFADIRDHRILSGFHTIALMIIIAGSHALLLTNILYYLRNKILFEKILLSMAGEGFMSFVAYLSWHPKIAFVVLFVLSIVLFFLLAGVFKIASFTIKTKVLFSSIYFVIIWAFLPLAILLPVKLILYKLLVADIINLYVYGFLVLYVLWILQRIMKGVYVIFDVNKARVYFYSILVIVLISGLVILYLQLNYSTVYYLLNALRQFQII